MKDAALAFLAIVAIGLAVIILREHREQFAVEAPITQTAAPSCPRLSNPCDRVNCNKPNTRIIA